MTTNDTTKKKTPGQEPGQEKELVFEELLYESNDAREITDLADMGLSYAYRILNHHTDQHFNIPYTTEDFEEVILELTTILKGVMANLSSANDHSQHVYHLLSSSKYNKADEQKTVFEKKVEKFFNGASEVGDPN
jgi:hypothetical protein|tara:strand:+ start:697 stop:1101 length:405 start_codon:yes stop_codon:yes gene_type:complete